MAPHVDSFDLSSLHLSSGEGRRLELALTLDPLQLGGQRYAVLGAPPPVAPDREAQAAPDREAQAAPDRQAQASGPEPSSVGKPALIEARLDVSRTTGSGYALRLRFDALVEGPCMRCLEAAAPTLSADAREVSQPGSGEELDSPYVAKGVLDIRGWARDALALALPPAILCRPDCAGLCPVCGVNLNHAGPEHRHEREPDPRWAKLSEIHFE